ncbi:hypothetical protein B0H12DRAFT_1277900 [Mycena haematopus]|nr:hypothetical protein B0H12DRAFT_1277900 [Mycena haematopus]
MFSALEADRALVAALTVQISDLENSILALRLEQARVQSRIDSYKYPVLTLPNEIVSEILTHVPPPYPSRAPFTGTLSPSSLTHICRRWREIALSLPSLWRAMNLTLNGISLEQRTHISDLWLKRSRSCPLSVEFDTRGDGYNNDVLEIFASVAAHRARLEHLKLILILGDLPSVVGSMPLLRCLHLEILYNNTLVAPVPFLDLPLLRNVVANKNAVLRVILPWAQLTSLVLTSVYLRECVPILQQTSNLIHCGLHLHYSVSEWFRSKPARRRCDASEWVTR